MAAKGFYHSRRCPEGNSVLRIAPRDLSMM
jgi:hypothetical protein